MSRRMRQMDRKAVKIIFSWSTGGRKWATGEHSGNPGQKDAIWRRLSHIRVPHRMPGSLSDIYRVIFFTGTPLKS